MVVLFVVILFLALATGEGVLYRLTYLLALVMGVSYAWTRLNLWRLDIRVEGQSSIAQVGDVLEGSIYVCNKSFLPTNWVEIMQMSDMPGDVCGGATRLPARGWEAWEVQRRCYARGVYTIGPLVACSSDFLGLFRVEVIRGDAIKVVVYPPAVELPYFRLPSAGLSGEERIRHRPPTRSAHAGTVREYDHGDSMNRIHWPSTAKHGRLMSKEFDSGGSGDEWIVVDLERRVQHSQGMERTDEYAVAAAASLARVAITDRRSVGLIAFGDQEYLLPLASGVRQMSNVLDTLAWSKTEGDTPLAEVLSQAALTFDRFASLLVVTSSTATEWVPVLQKLAYRGLTVVVVVVDPASFGGSQSCYEVVMRLVSAAIPAYMVRRGDALPLALAAPVTLHDLPVVEQLSASEVVPASKVS